MTRVGRNSPGTGDGGFALAGVLWFLLFATAVITPFVVTAQTNRWIAANSHQKVRLDLLADGLANLVSLHLSSLEATSQLLADWPFNSTLFSCSAGRYEAVIRLQDQLGLVDLNAADEALLAAGLRALGIVSSEVVPAVNAITAFRSPEPGQAADKPRAQIFGDRKGARFESALEAADIVPLGRIEPAMLRQAFTVHSRQGAVTLVNAPQRLAAALESLDASFGVIEDRVEGAPSAFAVEVKVRAGAGGIRGYAGFIAERSGPPAFQFRRLESLMERQEDGISEESTETIPTSCPAALQNDIEALMAGIAT